MLVAHSTKKRNEGGNRGAMSKRHGSAINGEGGEARSRLMSSRKRNLVPTNSNRPKVAKIR